MPHRGFEPASVLRLAFLSDFLPTELSQFYQSKSHCVDKTSPSAQNLTFIMHFISSVRDFFFFFFFSFFFPAWLYLGFFRTSLLECSLDGNSLNLADETCLLFFDSQLLTRSSVAITMSRLAQRLYDQEVNDKWSTSAEHNEERKRPTLSVMQSTHCPADVLRVNKRQIRKEAEITITAEATTRGRTEAS